MLGEEFPRGGGPRLWLRLWQAGAATIAGYRRRGPAGKRQTMGTLFQRLRQTCLRFHFLNGVDGIR